MGSKLSIHWVSMQVPQWAVPIPMGRRGGPGLSAMSEGWGHWPDYRIAGFFRGRNFSRIAGMYGQMVGKFSRCR